MLIKVNRRIPVSIGRSQIADGSLSLTLNTDLNAHAYLSAIPNTELNKILNNMLDDLITKLDLVTKEYDRRDYVE